MPEDVSVDMSSVTAVTIASSSHSINPISNYLREVEQRTAERKARKVAAARERAAQRLTPKAFSEADLARLEELKNFKKQRAKPTSITFERTAERTGTTLNTEQLESTVLPPLDTSFGSTFHKHDQKTQTIMILSLATLMFLLLYADILLGVKPMLAANHQKWFVSISMDVGTLVYLMACAAVHFVFCDVALLYAFHALEIGMKTGADTKQYYNGTIRTILQLLHRQGFLQSALQALLVQCFFVTQFGTLLSPVNKEMKSSHP